MYNFDQIIDRRNTNSCKWNVAENELPLWIADMDFKTAPCVQAAIEKRAEHGIFGYSEVPEEWAESYQFWWKTRHNFKIEKDWLLFCTGVVPAISSCVRKLTTPAEKVVIMTPVYNIFFNSIINNGRIAVESPLSYSGRKYSIDWERLEEDLSDPQTSLLILCNPHNPCGKIWNRAELAKIGALCEKYSVTVISDEIHCDITEPGKKYVPFASVNETCRRISVSCMSPAKCFNIAGINTAAVVVPDPALRHKVWRALNTDEVSEPNAFAVDAAVAAFTKGGEWLDELNVYLTENRRLAESFFRENLPKLKVCRAEATYLLWVDISRTGWTGEDFAARLREQTGLYICGGDQYGEAGEDFVRINLACPRVVLKEALNRLKEFVQ